MHQPYYLSPSPHATSTLLFLSGKASTTRRVNWSLNMVNLWPVQSPIYPKWIHFFSSVIGPLSGSSTNSGTCSDPFTCAFSLSQAGRTSNSTYPSDDTNVFASLGSTVRTSPEVTSCWPDTAEITGNLYGFLRRWFGTSGGLWIRFGWGRRSVVISNFLYFLKGS